MYSSFTIARKFIWYWLNASNRKGHGTHSPFVYTFIKQILNDKKTKKPFSEIESIRKNLLKNSDHIEVEDFGAGSGLLHTKKRRIDKIAFTSLKPKKYAQLIHRIVAYYQPMSMLELGTSFGITSAYIASANPAGNLVTLEGSDAIASIASKNFKKLQLHNIQLIQGEFSKTLPAFTANAKPLDFIFIDGNHRKHPTLEYFQQLLPLCNENSLLIFDDIHWSQEMESAWNEIKRHPSVTLTIDLFFVGLVFLKKDFKAKQHFSIQF